MVDTFYPDLSGNGKGVVDLDEVVHSEVEIMTNLALTLSGLGATPGVTELTGLSMTAASNLVNSSTAQFASSDVGKAIVIGGAGQALAAGGNDKLKTYITQYNANNQVVVSNVAVATVSAMEGAMGWDASSFIQDGLDILLAAQGGTLIVDGLYITTQPVSVDLSSSIQAGINMIGLGTDCALWCATSISTDCFGITNGGINVSNLSFVGTRTARSDCRRLFNFSACNAAFYNCNFVGLIAMDGVLRSENGSSLFTKKCNFGGCFCVGSAGLTYSVIENISWMAYRDEGSTFKDFAQFRGKNYSKSGYAGLRGWVRLSTPSTALGTNRQSIGYFVDSRFDEGAVNGVVVEPVTGTIDAVVFDGTRHNVTGAETGRGIHCKNVTNVLISKASFGWATAPALTAYLENCTRVVIDSITVSASANSLLAYNVGSLEVINQPSGLTTFDIQNSNYLPINTTTHPYAMIINTAPTDSLFSVPPKIGTKVLDRVNAREYTKKLRTEGWGYVTLSGTVEGPELVTNGTFTSDTAGWTTANGATFVSTAGTGRLTNAVTGGKAYQSITTVIGDTYKYSIQTVGGTAGAILARLGTSLDDPSYANITALGTTTTIYFVPTTTTTYITLIINAATGTYYDFDNVSMKAV